MKSTEKSEELEGKSVASTGPDLKHAKLGPFRLGGPIGRGSFARVFDARHEESGERLALKWIEEPGSVPRLKREFRLARALRHPNLVRLHELHERAEGAFFTMERIAGRDVVGRCAQEPDAVRRTELSRVVFAQLADALAYLHAGGLVHGDLKPANVLMAEEDRPVLVDFELAHRLEPRQTSGRFSGTFAYAAPELLRGSAPSPHTDWFAFGVLLFEALTGHLPFGPDPAKTTTAWFNARRVDSAESLPEAARPLAPLLDQLMAPSASRRAGASEVFRVLGAPRRWVRAPELVERADDVDALLAMLGRPHARVALSGTPGVGKTRLAREVLERLDVPVLAGVCHPREHVVFNALDGPIHQLVEWGRAKEAKEAVRMLEESAVDRRTNLEGLARAFVHVAGISTDGPVILFVDGAQWADPDSAALLKRVHSMAEATSLDLRQVVTTSADASELARPFRPRRRSVIRLAPLTSHGGDALLRSVEPTMASPVRDHLVELCEGNPLLLERAALWHRERGANPEWPKSAAELALSTSPRATDTHRALLEILAVHGSPLDSEVIGACGGMALSTTCDLLEEGLVQLERDADGRHLVLLCHQQSSTALLSALGDATKRDHHLRLAGAFERAMPADVDARFRHWAAAGEPERARAVALDSARALTAKLAFHRAAQRYRWLLTNGDETIDLRLVRSELAAVLARAGDAIEAAEIYEALAEGGERGQLERMAAEQWLRAGEVERGRALLRRCMERAGTELPDSVAGRARALIQARKEVRGLPLDPPPRTPDAATDEAIELAWSTGLGLNLVHLADSAVAQARFTALALRDGRPDQVGRALAVEYSYTMLAGGPGATRHGERLRAAMARLAPSVDLATRAMMHLSTGAGDYFRGSLRAAERQLAKASAHYAELLGARSWERANCEMYASWVALERGELDSVVARVPAQAALARERGDTLYRQCFYRGFSGTAWLIRGQPEALRSRLDSLSLPPGGFELPHFLDLIARVRLDLYLGDDAWARFAAAWPKLRSSGQWLFRWPRYAIARLAVQAAIGSDREREARRWIPRLLLTGHPEARPWATLATGLLDERYRLVERARDLFERQGMTLGALAADHHLLGTELGPARTPGLMRATALGRP